jgi:hypothetical protein
MNPSSFGRRRVLLTYDPTQGEFQSAVVALVESETWLVELDVRNRVAIVEQDPGQAPPAGWIAPPELPPNRLALGDPFVARGMAQLDSLLGIRGGPACLSTARMLVGDVPPGKTDLMLTRSSAPRARRPGERPRLHVEPRPASSSRFAARTRGIPGFEIVRESGRMLRVRCDSGHGAFLSSSLTGLGWDVRARFERHGDVTLVCDGAGGPMPLAVQMLANLGLSAEAVLSAMHRKDHTA